MLLARASGLRSQHCPTAFLRLVNSAGFATGSGASKVVEVKSDAEYQQLHKQLTESGGLGILDFTAKWCGPCKAIAPIFDKLSQKYPEVMFLKLDIDAPELNRTVTEHNVTGVPMFVYYKDGRRVEAFSGARPDMLEDLIKKHTK